MKKIAGIILIVLLAGFVLIQFKQPVKNSEQVTENHLYSKVQVPDSIKAILNTACMDCHSSQTRYLWYHKISPVSWLVAMDIKKGKKELNFSNWNGLDDDSKISKLGKISEEVENKRMPIKPYLLMHPDAKLKKEQVDLLMSWTEKYSEEILASQEDEGDSIK